MQGSSVRRRRLRAAVHRATARVAAGAVITVGVSAGVVAMAGVAEAHTGTLGAVAVCVPATGTYTVTYSGVTTNVPATGAGHTATLTVGEIVPATGTTIVGAPATVVGNTSYSFQQVGVPGNALVAKATAFLVWGDGATSDPQGIATLAGNCTKQATPVAPSASASSCTEGGDVVSGGITIPTTTGVIYKIDGTTVTGFVAKPAGTYVVTPVAAAGYTLTSSTPFTVVVPAGPVCLHPATPVAPSVTQSRCTEGSSVPTTPSYTIPTTTGIAYYVGNAAVPTPAGTYLATAGTTLTVTPHALAGYTLAPGSPASFTLTFDAAPDCTTHVQPATPSVTQEHCTGLGTASDAFLTIPATAGVAYLIDGVPAAAGTVVEAPGTYTVTATALPGYTLDGTALWSLTVDAALDCTEHVTPATPSVTQSECTGLGQSSAATITIPATTGIQYAIDGVPAAAGSVVETAGSYAVTATALPGYTLEGTALWTLVVDAAPDCTEHVTPAAASVTPAECTGPGTSSAPFVTIPATTGVVYALDGVVTAAGDVPVSAGAHTVTATPLAGYTLEGTTTWELATGDTPNCDVEVGALATPSVTASHCEGDKEVPGTYTIGSTPGVDYFVDGAPVAAGTYDATPGSVVHVTAVPQQGYVLPAEAQSSWDLTFAKAACVLGEHVVKPPVTKPVVRPSRLPNTGAPTGLTVLAGLALLTVGGALTMAGLRRTTGVLAG